MVQDLLQTVKIVKSAPRVFISAFAECQRLPHVVLNG